MPKNPNITGIICENIIVPVIAIIITNIMLLYLNFNLYLI
jgi:hypothetical protein